MALIVGEERTRQLEASRGVIIELGETIPEDSHSIFEQRAQEFVDYVQHEAGNYDWKILPDQPLPSVTETKNAFGNDAQVRVRTGNTTSNPNMGEMVTVEFSREDGTPRRLRVSHPSKGDRRWREDTTALGRVGLDHAGQLIDVHTRARISLDDLPRERLIIDGESRDDTGFLLIQMSRYIWNLVRGNRKINLNQVDAGSWVPYVKCFEDYAPLSVANGVPLMVARGEIDPSTLEEFRHRMMSCFCINPRLFLNFTHYFHISAIFPFFEKHEQRHKFFENVDDIPGSPAEFDDLLRTIVGDDYNSNLSPLGNVAHIFGIGIGGWSGTSELM